MSSVSNYILMFAPSDEAAIYTLNLLLIKEQNGHEDQKFYIAETEGRQLEAGIAYAALNYLWPSELVDLMVQVKWLHPGMLQLMVKRSDDHFFEEVLLAGKLFP